MAAIERTYNVPLRREFLKSPKYKRAKTAINALKRFLSRHMKSEQIFIGRKLNEKIWERGIKNPPHHVHITVVKEDDGKVYAELVGFKYEKPVVEEEKKKKKEEKVEEKEPIDFKKTEEEKKEEKKLEEKTEKIKEEKAKTGKEKEKEIEQLEKKAEIVEKKVKKKHGETTDIKKEKKRKERVVD